MSLLKGQRFCCAQAQVLSLLKFMNMLHNSDNTVINYVTNVSTHVYTVLMYCSLFFLNFVHKTLLVLPRHPHLTPCNPCTCYEVTYGEGGRAGCCAVHS